MKQETKPEKVYRLGCSIDGHTIGVKVTVKYNGVYRNFEVVDVYYNGETILLYEGCSYTAAMDTVSARMHRLVENCVANLGPELLARRMKEEKECQNE